MLHNVTGRGLASAISPIWVSHPLQSNLMLNGPFVAWVTTRQQRIQFDQRNPDKGLKHWSWKATVSNWFTNFTGTHVVTPLRAALRMSVIGFRSPNFRTATHSARDFSNGSARICPVAESRGFSHHRHQSDPPEATQQGRRTSTKPGLFAHGNPPISTIAIGISMWMDFFSDFQPLAENHSWQFRNAFDTWR